MITDDDVIVKDSYDPNSDIGIKHMIEDMKTVYKSFKQPTNMYNKRGVISITPSEDMIFTFMKPSTMERLKVYVNSAAYNLDEVMLKGRVIFIPEDMTLGTDTSGNEILAMILDRRALVVGLRTWKMRDFEIPNKLRRNYFLSIEGIRGHNDFINAVAFKGAKVANFQSEGSDSNAYSFSYDGYPLTVSSYSIDGEIVQYSAYGYTNLIFTKSVGFNVTNSGSGDISEINYCAVNNNGDFITDIFTDNNTNIQVGEIGEYVIDMESKIIHTPSKDYDISSIISQYKKIYGFNIGYHGG